MVAWRELYRNLWGCAWLDGCVKEEGAAALRPYRNQSRGYQIIIEGMLYGLFDRDGRCGLLVERLHADTGSHLAGNRLEGFGRG